MKVYYARSVFSVKNNKWNEFAGIFGLKLRELFYLEYDEYVYRFTENGLEYALSDDAEDEDWIYSSDSPRICSDMLDGTRVIENCVSKGMNS